MCYFDLRKKLSPLTQHEAVDNCTQHLLMSNLTTEAYGALTCDRYFISTFHPSFSNSPWNRCNLPFFNNEDT